MIRSVVVGLDGSAESRAAVEWAAHEAKRRFLPLRLVHVWEPVHGSVALAQLLGAEARNPWSERLSREVVEGLGPRHPGLDVSVEQVPGRPAEVLTRVAKDAELLVLGSRGMSGIDAFLVGSVGQAVVAHAERPVVLVRAGERAADGPVVLGLDTDHPDDTVIAYAFEAAARRVTPLRVIHAWNPPPYFAHGLPTDPELNAALGKQDAVTLAELLHRWKEKYPAVEVREESRSGSPAVHLADASREASLVVVGRRGPLGGHIGPVTQAVLHHATAPVAVVAHD
ncbi:universal stress protein [Streptomyces malaysiensis]|uniref:universal stress protein n=1 Tax=Streptomyces malaysiensis TaxID=92644 RepID=UPI002B27E33A|nr:universal stress protein [Streptomyces malaysiensis]